MPKKKQKAGAGEAVAAPAAAEAPAGEGGGGKRRKRAAKKDETALDVPQDELARRWVDYAGSWRAEHHGGGQHRSRVYGLPALTAPAPSGAHH